MNDLDKEIQELREGIKEIENALLTMYFSAWNKKALIGIKKTREFRLKKLLEYKKN